jgi:5'-nucleotidase
MATAAAAQAQSPLKVNILHINDHHSHLPSETFDMDVSGMDLNTTLQDGSLLAEVELTYGGYPLLTTSIKELEAEVANPILLHAGDAITGTLYYTLFAGEADAEIMNQICFDAFALGNHEFDDGDAGLAGFLDFLGTGDCNTPVLAANVVPGPDSALNTADYLQPYTIVERGGQEIGIIGIDIAGKTKNSSSPDEDTEFLDETETAQLYIDELTAMGVNKIVLLTHIGYGNDMEMAASLSGVDVIVGGDSHTLLGGDNVADAGFPVDGDYPSLATDQNGNTVCVVQAWEYAHLYGRLLVEFNDLGEVVECRGNPIMPIGKDVVYEDSDESEQLLKGDDRKRVLKSLVQYPEFQLVKEEDAATVALLEEFDEQVTELEQTVIGEVATDLCLERWPGQGQSSLCTPEATTANGSDISNIVAKAFLTVTPTADFAIQNGGGVRVDVPAGDYTIADAYTLLPFSNTLVILEMTGQEVIDVLEDALSNTLDDGGSTGSYPYASGIRYHVDASAGFGNRVSNAEVNPQLAGEWMPIDNSATYFVVTNDFIASGRDGYDTFAPIFEAGKFEDTFTEYAQGFVDYVEGLAESGEAVDKLPLAEYSTQSYIGTDGCDHSSESCEGF